MKIKNTDSSRFFINKILETKGMTQIVNEDAAGIDISSKEMVVAIGKERSKDPIRTFKSFTSDLHELANWLLLHGITTVAMESTGVYWYHLYTVLEAYGIEVSLVNAQHVKRVPSRKSDVNDAQWLQQLHSFGLLRSCFQPDNLTRSLRNSVRLRKQTIKEISRQILRMQKAMEQMNIKLHTVINDITGKTGMAIIGAILQGERNAAKLSSLCDKGIRASKEIIIKSLEGNWREEQLFNLKMAYEHLMFLQGQLEQCDQESERIIQQFDQLQDKEIKGNRRAKNQPKFKVEQYLSNICGVDVTKIPGIKSTTALTIFSEIGPNLKGKFPTEKQFLSWLNVVPDNEITGGKIVKSRIKKKKNRAGQAFREAANALWQAKNPLGETLRKKKSKSGSNRAIVFMARKIASIYYKMVTEREEYDVSKIMKHIDRNIQNKIIYLEQLTAKLKSQLTENQATAKVDI